MTRPGLILTTLALLALAGCGFQLRGTTVLPQALQPLALDCTESVPARLCTTVREQLELAGREPVAAARADYRLLLTGFEQQRRTSAITARAETAEYELGQSLRLSVITRDQVPLLADTEVRALRNYRFDDTNVLAKRREQDEIRDTLYRDLAQQVMFRLTPLNRTRIDALRKAATDEAGTAP